MTEAYESHRLFAQYKLDLYEEVCFTSLIVFLMFFEKALSVRVKDADEFMTEIYSCLPKEIMPLNLNGNFLLKCFFLLYCVTDVF